MLGLVAAAEREGLPGLPGCLFTEGEALKLVAVQDSAELDLISQTSLTFYERLCCSRRGKMVAQGWVLRSWSRLVVPWSQSLEREAKTGKNRQVQFGFRIPKPKSEIQRFIECREPKIGIA